MLGRPGPTVHPMAWVGTRAGAKSSRPSADALAWPSEEGDRRSATATRTSRDKGPLRPHAAHPASRCPDWRGIGSDQRDGSADRDDAIFVAGPTIGAVNACL